MRTVPKDNPFVKLNLGYFDLGFSMDPRHLVQLATILECGSLSKASQVLHLTQPTLTHNMQALESRAGGQLFERSRFGVRSTALGEVLAREGRAIARRMRDADEACSRHRSGFVQTVRLGTGPLVGAALMPGLLAALDRQQARHALSVGSDRPHLLLDQLVDGRYDFVIAPSWLDKPPPGVERFLLVRDEIGVYCGRSHPLAGNKAWTASGGDGIDWITLGSTSPFQQNVRDMLRQAGITRVRPVMSVMGESHILLGVLSQGRHLSVLPKFPLRILGPAYALVELPVDAPPFHRDIYLWCRSVILEDPSMAELKDRILAHAREA